MNKSAQAAIWGALAGVTAGSPRIGQSVFREMRFYEPIPTRMAPSSALDAWWVLHRLAPHQQAASQSSGLLARHWRFSDGAAAFAVSNLRYGMRAPASGAFQNPLADGSSAILRALLWGVLFPGHPDQAAEYAYFDNSSDHSGVAVEAGVQVAVLTSLLLADVSFSEALRTLSASFSADSSLTKMIPVALRAAQEPEGSTQVAQRLSQALGQPSLSHAGISFGLIVYVLLKSSLKFEEGVSLAVGLGHESHVVAGCVGAITAGLRGSIPEDWKAPLGKDYLSGHGLSDIAPPGSLEEFVKSVAGAAVEPPVAETKPLDSELQSSNEEPDSNSSDDEAPAEATVHVTHSVVTPGLSDRIKRFTSLPPMLQAVEKQGLAVGVRYLNQPIALPKRNLELSLSFHNKRNEPIELEPRLEAPEGWAVATNMSSFRVDPDQAVSFAALLSPQTSVWKPFQEAKLTVADIEHRLPITGSARWYVVGPFVNHEGTGYSKRYPAEDKLVPGEVFNGRSDLPVKWTEIHFPGVLYDLEPTFKTGPGTVLLAARINFAEPGNYRLVVSTSCGARASVNDQEILAYHDEHIPTHRPREPYVGSFETKGEAVLVVIKLLRNRTPLQQAAIYFLNENGYVVHPSGYLPLDG